MEPTRAALVVAAHEFVDQKFQRLRSPAKDVDALAAVLGDPSIGGFEVETVVNQPSSVVAQELERFFSGRKPDDLLLLYFSCHGVKDPTGRLYFVTTNTMFDLLRSTGVSASFVGEQMEYSRSKRIVVLLDCCYSGAFLKGFRARGDDSVAVDQLEGRGRAVITASRATEYAFEADHLASENAQPSLFTGAIVEGLTSGTADGNGDGLVTVDELYDYVYDAVRGKVAGQTPGRWIDVEGDLVVARNPVPPVRAAELPAELRRAVESDAALQRLGAVSELARWYGGDDAARQLAAATVLDLLSHDYDERVKMAARAALSGTTAPHWSPPPETQPIPATAPKDATEAVAAAPATEPEAASVAEHEAEPEPTPATEPEPTPVTEPATGPAPVPTVAAKPLPAVGWLAVFAGLAVFVAPNLDYLRYEGYAERLGSRQLFGLGAVVFLALAGLAGFVLLRPAGRREIGLAILAGLVPVVIGEGIIGISDLADNSNEAVEPGAGWFLIEIGLALLAVAGLIAAMRLRPYVSQSPRIRRVRDVATTGSIASALLIGALASLGWARLAGFTGDGLFGVASSVQSFVLQLLVVGVLGCLAWGWEAEHPGNRGVIGWGILLLPAGIVMLFATDEVVFKPTLWLPAAAYVAFGLGAATVPVLAAVIGPGRVGAVLLGAWVLGSAAWLPSVMARDAEGGLLAVALVAAALLAAYLARSMWLPASEGRDGVGSGRAG